MFDGTLVFVALVFVLAGIVKGVIGLGLPTIAMGLLALSMPPVEAAAILLLPSFATNLWQALTGPAFAGVLRRLWPMLLAVCIGTWAGLGLMTGTNARFGTALLGTALAIYAVTGLAELRLPSPKAWEPVLSPIVGAVTGLITAATGVFVIPAVPYLQAIVLQKEEFVQSLGLSFTVSTLALAVNIGSEGEIGLAMAAGSLVGLGAASAGMWLGQILRGRLSAAAFRKTFFLGLLVLGIHLAARSVL